MDVGWKSTRGVRTAPRQGKPPFTSCMNGRSTSVLKPNSLSMYNDKLRVGLEERGMWPAKKAWVAVDERGEALRIFILGLVGNKHTMHGWCLFAGYCRRCGTKCLRRMCRQLLRDYLENIVHIVHYLRMTWEWHLLQIIVCDNHCQLRITNC